MSVHGEFDRYLIEVQSALRATGRDEFLAWADTLDGATDMTQPLELRAQQVMNGPLGQETSEWQGFARLAADVNTLISISRIILGS